MDNYAGQQIKGYELQERLAAGGFGAVYRAFQSTIRREVAIKVILPGLANRPEFIRRFDAEAQLIARLEHMNIVPLYDYWRDPNGAFLVMRFLRGGSLQEHICKHGALDVEEAFNVFAQVAHGLHIAHRNQIVHRDIKPANILLDEDHNGYLSDFGIAKDYTLSQSITEPDSFIGSPEYLAPEQARSEPVTPQTDIYSLGVVLYEMLTGEHPFPGLDKISYIYKHLNDCLPEILNLDDGIRNEVNAVIQKATAKDPRHRYQDVVEMVQALRQAARLDAAPTPHSMVELLTLREQEVLQLIIDGKSNREIADILVLAEGTVKQYITSIYRKLNVRSRVQAIARARDWNFVIVKPEVSVTTGHLPEPENPYKGLRAFQAADAQDFYGREKLIHKLLARLQEDVEFQRLLVVIGPSGSGKSSAVKAGLIPALWRGELPGSEKWYIIDMLPGAHPIDELEVALFRVTTDKTIHLRDQLERDGRGLIRAANMILPDDGSELVVLIDQFEEVFTLVDNDDERLHFLNLLEEAVTDQRSRLRIVLTLRADYYDRPLQYPDFGELVRGRLETVLPLSAAELERAIHEPARRAGVTYEAGLVSRIVSDVHYQPGALPLLQYALTELFERRNNRVLTLEAYEAIGGTGGALAHRADEIYLEQDKTGRELIHQLFLRQVTLGEGAEDTRRRVERSELLELATEHELMDEILDLFVASRLLSLDNDPSSRQPTVEVAHEAILREWDRLRQWLNESRDDIRQERAISRAAEEWDQHKRDASFLLRGARLEQAENWRDTTTLIQTQLEQNFITQSLRRRDQEQRAELERQEWEDQLERRSRSFLRWLVAIFALATLIATFLTIIALTSSAEAAIERDNAQDNFLRAERIRLAAQAQLALDRGEDVRIPALLALRSLELEYSPEADGALLSALSRDFSRQTYVGHSGNGITQVTFSPAGSQVLTASTDATARLWDTFTSEELQRFVGHVGIINDVAFMPDGSSILTGGNDGTIREWDVASGEEMRQLQERDVPIRYISLSPDGQFLATSDETHGAQVWRLDDDMELLFELSGHTDLVNQMAFSPDGETLATASHDGTIRLWDKETGEEIQRFVGHATGVWGIAFAPSGDRIVSGSADQTARIWDVETGEEIRRLIGHPGTVFNVAFSPDGHTIATTSATSDLAIRLWDAETGVEITRLEGHTAPPTGTAFSPDGQYLLSGSIDNVPRLWEVRAESEPRVYSQPTDTVHANISQFAILSSDANQIVSVVSNGMVRTWDVQTHEKISEIRAESDGFVTGAAISVDHNLVLTGSEGGIVRLWKLGTGELIRQYEGHTEAVTSIKFSPSMGFFITGSNDNTAILWAIDSDKPLMHLKSHMASVTDVAFSPNDRLVVTVSEDGSAILWDTETGAEIRRFVGKGGTVLSVAFSPDSRYLLTGCDDNTATLWNIETGEIVQQLVGHTAPVQVVAFSQDGRTIVTGSQDQTARLWDAESGQTVRQFFGHISPLRTVDLSDDGELLVTGDNDSIYLWRTNLEDIVALACEKISNDLTVEERVLYEIHADNEVCQVE